MKLKREEQSQAFWFGLWGTLISIVIIAATSILDKQITELLSTWFTVMPSYFSPLFIITYTLAVFWWCANVSIEASSNWKNIYWCTLPIALVAICAGIWGGLHMLDWLFVLYLDNFQQIPAAISILLPILYTLQFANMPTTNDKMKNDFRRLQIQDNNNLSEEITERAQLLDYL